MKQLTKYILERLVLSKNKKSTDSFKTIQMFMQDEEFDINGVSLDYFKGIASNDHQIICYVECFNERFGNRFMLVIFGDDVYMQLVNEYNLEEVEDLGWNEAPEELVEIVQDKLDTELPVYICGTGLWCDSRYNYTDTKRYERYIENICKELQ